MVIQRFEEIIAWQKAQDLAVHIHLLFKSNKDFGFNDQLLRATISISNNIAEGFDRSSDADFIRFLYIATGSASEVRSMLYLAKRFNYISEEEQQTLMDKANEISKIIYGLIKSISNNKTLRKK